MRIGYPCINYTLGCSTNNTCRLKSYSEHRVIEIIKKNLYALTKILNFNKEQGFLFFRIGSGMIPFASHQICQLDWVSHFKHSFKSVGEFIKQHNMRISMHPDQFVVLNSPNVETQRNSITELTWHCQLLDALGLDETAKVQIHVGGVYGEKEKATQNFINAYLSLSQDIKKRLVIENDDRLFSVADCLRIYEKTRIPIIFDTLHHKCLNNGETIHEAMIASQGTWQEKDGCPMVDYSTQELGARVGKHANSIDLRDFKEFIALNNELDFDIMLEIKDKEISASKALQVIQAASFRLPQETTQENFIN